MSDVDFFSNYYVAHGDLQAKLIANTVPVQIHGREDISAFTQGILPTENQMKRMAGDSVVNPTALTRYGLNSDTPDTGRESVSSMILPTPSTTLLGGEVSLTQGVTLKIDAQALPNEQLDVLNVDHHR